MVIILTFISSFIALLWAANHVVTGAKGLVAYYHLSPFILSVSFIAFGTTTPELIISLMSAIDHKNELAIGNAIGSNIANIGLVIGLINLIQPMKVNFSTIKKAYPVLLISMIFVYGLMLDGFLGRVDGCLLLLTCILLITVSIYLEYRSHKQDAIINAFKTASVSRNNLKSILLSLFVGLIILPISAKYIVMSATEMAQWSGLSELTIGLTVIGIGTSLPELATSVIAIIKGEEDMAIGVILGSNIYNLLLIIALPGLFNPSRINPSVLWRDMPVLIAITILLFFLNFNYKNKPSRWHGGILLLIYCSYILSLIIRG